MRPATGVIKDEKGLVLPSSLNSLSNVGQHEEWTRLWDEERVGN